VDLPRKATSGKNLRASYFRRGRNPWGNTSAGAFAQREDCRVLRWNESTCRHLVHTSAARNRVAKDHPPTTALLRDIVTEHCQGTLREQRSKASQRVTAG